MFFFEVVLLILMVVLTILVYPMVRYFIREKVNFSEYIKGALLIYEKFKGIEVDKSEIIQGLCEVLSIHLRLDNKVLTISKVFNATKDTLDSSFITVEDYVILRAKYFPKDIIWSNTKGVRGLIPWIVVYMDLINMYYKEDFENFDNSFSNIYDLKFETLKRTVSDSITLNTSYYYGAGVLHNMVYYKCLVCDDSKINYQKFLVFLIQRGLIKYSDEKPWYAYVSYREIFQFFEQLDRGLNKDRSIESNRSN